MQASMATQKVRGSRLTRVKYRKWWDVHGERRHLCATGHGSRIVCYMVSAKAVSGWDVIG